jgi:hypothetical protein
VSVLELPLGLDGDPDVVVSLGVLGVAVGGGGVVGGEADGVRSRGRSPTRSVPESVQAVASVPTSASAARPNSALFMSSLLGVRPRVELATEVPASTMADVRREADMEDLQG